MSKSTATKSTATKSAKPNPAKPAKPNYPATTGNRSGGGRGNVPKPKGK